MAEGSNTYEAGQEAGRVAQILVEHAKHFSALNGSVEKTGVKLDGLASEIRGVREDMRLAAERVEVAASVLAQETERRREALAANVSASDRAIEGADRAWSRRERMGAAAIGVLAAVLGYISANGLPL